MHKSNTLLGIETSCDETAAAVYSGYEGIRSSVLFSQIEIHRLYGGVVPELASRSHVEKIPYIVRKALERAECDLEDIDVVAVTNRPGLPGSLLVGVCFAKAIAWAGDIKLIGVDHLEGHVFSSCIENTVPFPHLCLTASGGHTSIYKVNNFGNFELLGTTLDDAAGEAFDKIAKLLGLPYPGGPIIEKLAQQADFKDFFSYPRSHIKTLNFSFSGLKTAVLYDLVKRGAYDLQKKQLLDDSQELKVMVASSLLVCIKDVFIQTFERAYQQNPTVEAATFVGGVACNKFIRSALHNWAEQRSLPFYVPTPAYCTDNAAMIAFVGHYKAQQGLFSDLYLDILK